MNNNFKTFRRYRLIPAESFNNSEQEQRREAEQKIDPTVPKPVVPILSENVKVVEETSGSEVKNMTLDKMNKSSNSTSEQHSDRIENIINEVVLNNINREREHNDENIQNEIYNMLPANNKKVVELFDWILKNSELIKLSNNGNGDDNDGQGGLLLLSQQRGKKEPILLTVTKLVDNLLYLTSDHAASLGRTLNARDFVQYLENLNTPAKFYNSTSHTKLAQQKPTTTKKRLPNNHKFWVSL